MHVVFNISIFFREQKTPPRSNGKCRIYKTRTSLCLDLNKSAIFVAKLYYTLSSTSDIQAETQLLKLGSDQYDLLQFPFKHSRVEMPGKDSLEQYFLLYL